ncbi:AAA domain-containing protein [Mycena haematopus]|nr:AAA domain-containing protein [Mycena haematopus]
MCSVDENIIQNYEEIQTISHLVRRYVRTNFCVITPYDAQRAAIERQLKAENLPHHAVYNVDTFQGNEADYVLVSVVRTEAPGFLRSLNRINVMLTRAKKGMVIVTCSSFLRSANGAETLLGRLARYWETHQQEMWIDWRRVADGTADLPGSPGIPSLAGPSAQSQLSDFPLATNISTSEKLVGTWDLDFPPLALTSPSVQSNERRTPFKLGPSVRPLRVLGAPPNRTAA